MIRNFYCAGGWVGGNVLNFLSGVMIKYVKD